MSSPSPSMMSLPGAFPSVNDLSNTVSTQSSNQQSLSSAVHARRAEFTRLQNIRIKVGTWNVAAFKGTEKDLGGWFVGGKGVAEALTGLKVSDQNEVRPAERITEELVPGKGDSKQDDGHSGAKKLGEAVLGLVRGKQEEQKQTRAQEEMAGKQTQREDVGMQEARHNNKTSTIPKDDVGSVPGGEEIGIYAIGLQEIVDVTSASEALWPYQDPSAANRYKVAMEEALPSGYTLVAEQQLIGLLLLVYASPQVAPHISSVSTTSVGTGLMGYMGNKGAVTARMVLGDTTRLVFVNCHLAAGTEKGAVERRNWDFSQIVSRTRFSPIIDSFGIAQRTGEAIGDEDFAFWLGDLNYRLEGMPGDDVRRLLLLHTRNEYNLSDRSANKIMDAYEEAKAGSTLSVDTKSMTSTESGSIFDGQSAISSATEQEPELDPTQDPTSLQTMLSSLLPHDELRQQQNARKAFHDGWREGPITFLPTYKYDVGSVGVFDSSEKRRTPSWCDRILYRTRRDKLAFDIKIKEEEEAKKRDADMKAKGLDKAADDEDVLFDYNPETDGDAGEFDTQEYEEYLEDDSTVVTKEGYEDEIKLEYYTAHQRVLSSDHKPLDAVFDFKYEAVVPELKAKIHQEVARELDKSENEHRPNLTVLVDRPPGERTYDASEGINFGSVRFAQSKHRTLSIANTGRVAATFNFIGRPGGEGPGQTDGAFPTWLRPHLENTSIPEDQITLQPGESTNVELTLKVSDFHLARRLNDEPSLHDVLVLRVKDGRDYFLPVQAKWLRTSFGQTIDKLIRIPEGGIRKLQHQKPFGSSSPSIDSPVRWSAPRELFRLTEAIEVLVERSIAEWDMTHDAPPLVGKENERKPEAPDKPPWVRFAGWPFADESWTLEPGKQRDELRLEVYEALDTDSPFELAFPPETPALQRLEVLAEVLLFFLWSLEDGIITDKLWKEIEPGIISRDKARKPSGNEEFKTFILDILSSAPNHNISFIFLTSMMNKIISSIMSAESSSTKDPAARPQTPRTSTSSRPSSDLPDSPRASVRRKTLSKVPEEARRQIMQKNLAAIFAEVMIKAPKPAKDKERRASDERRAAMVEAFLKDETP